MKIPILGKLIDERLMKIPILGKLIDERFLNHRLRAMRVAGIIGCIVAVVLLFYRYFVNHVESWDLFAVIVTIATVFVVLMTWYLLTD